MTPIKPSTFAHIVYQTHRFDEMIAWYEFVFDAHVSCKTEALAFMTYDEEHHRMAFINLGAVDGEPPMKAGGVGAHHVAYTWRSLEGLMSTYQRLKQKGILPFTRLRHGPTLSLYYADPDGNGMEFQIDLLTVDEANQFMHSPAFHANPVGEEFDADEVYEAFVSGQPVEELIYRTDQARSAFPLNLKEPVN